MILKAQLMTTKIIIIGSKETSKIIKDRLESHKIFMFTIVAINSEKIKTVPNY